MISLSIEREDAKNEDRRKQEFYFSIQTNAVSPNVSRAQQCPGSYELSSILNCLYKEILSSKKTKASIHEDIRE